MVISQSRRHPNRSYDWNHKLNIQGLDKWIRLSTNNIPQIWLDRREYTFKYEDPFLERDSEIHVYKDISKAGFGPSVYYFDEKVRI